jgi:hypothetical protein
MAAKAVQEVRMVRIGIRMGWLSGVQSMPLQPSTSRLDCGVALTHRSHSSLSLFAPAPCCLLCCRHRPYGWLLLLQGIPEDKVEADLYKAFEGMCEGTVSHTWWSVLLGYCVNTWWSVL